MNIDEMPLNFGKYKGKTPEEVADEDPSYVTWMYDKITPKPCSKTLAIACEHDEREDDEDRYWPLDD